MQRLIDANKLEYTCNSDEGGMLTGCNHCQYHIVTEDEIDKASTVLSIPENPTNGNMIRAMFPNVVIRVVTESQIGISFFDNQNKITWIPIEWWNASHKESKHADSD